MSLSLQHQYQTTDIAKQQSLWKEHSLETKEMEIQHQLSSLQSSNDNQHINIVV